MGFLSAPSLRGPLGSLVPLSPDHAQELAEASADGDLHRLWYANVPAPEAMDQEISSRLRRRDDGQLVPWTIQDARGRAVGMTTFLHPVPEHRRVEIGSTWIAASAQGTGLNPQIKLLQLRHAFETLECIAVELRTHWHNRQSRAAIASLGAKQDGVLRSHQIMPDGSLRDTVVFSITAAEWPAVRRSLAERLRSRWGVDDPFRA
ncbi:GNAT family N-acetyltransferase [Kocuria palustris]|uniref:GNAT family N-acetyltransferase n=1 Tax=Kocuria palustris TaxID=71999 RepID=UPI0011A1B28C|nr:GNAT family protein [Kocuria palustris]